MCQNAIHDPKSARLIPCGSRPWLIRRGETTIIRRGARARFFASYPPAAVHKARCSSFCLPSIRRDKIKRQLHCSLKSRRTAAKTVRVHAVAIRRWVINAPRRHFFAFARRPCTRIVVNAASDFTIRARQCYLKSCIEYQFCCSRSSDSPRCHETQSAISSIRLISVDASPVSTRIPNSNK